MELDNNSNDKLRNSRPSQLMREWHPDLFPDSEVVQEPTLTRAVLEYHLETITARKQEQLFEEFCRRLLEREVCPNIKPQTGSTGGGDSKTDGMTYPVAPALALRYYWANPNPPTDENWAFGFSCMKSWRKKIRDDAAKVAGLPRRFTKAYFVTSQYARDKERSALEHELTKKHGFEAHILDRSWITRSVLEHGHQRIAAEVLGLGEHQETRSQPGPLDAARQQELHEVRERIARLEAQGGPDVALSLDHLDAALLARGLGRPRHEIEGHFAIARRCAEAAGSRTLQVRSGYNLAWTLFWWFDDARGMARLYSELEPLVADTPDVNDLELLSNLLHLLLGEIWRGTFTPEDVQLTARRDRLRRELERLAAEANRPTSSLKARAYLAFLRTTELADPTVLDEVIREFLACVKSSLGHLAFPARRLVRQIRAIEQALEEHPSYEELFDAMCQAVRDLDGAAAEGELLYKRGFAHLSAGRADAALEFLGRAKLKLAQEGTLQASARAALGCAAVYQKLGLFWAMKMEALSAAHTALLKDGGEIRYPWEAFWALSYLARQDLASGHLCGFLAWYELGSMVAGYEQTRGRDTKHFGRELDELGTLLAVRLLREAAPGHDEFLWMLPALERLQLHTAQCAVRYLAGRKEELFAECSREFAATSEELDQRFLELSKLVEDSHQLRPLVTPETPWVIMTTRRFGVEYCVTAKNEPAIILLAENLLGIIEAALAVARWENLAYIVDRFELTVDVSPRGLNPPNVDFVTPTRGQGYRLDCGPDLLGWLGLGANGAAGDFLHEFLFAVLVTTTIDPMEDLRAEFQEWHKAGTFTRALAFSPTSVLVGNLVGGRWHDRSSWTHPAAPPPV